MEDRLVVRYRKKKDDDLKQAMENLPLYLDRSDVVRDALRVYLPMILDGLRLNTFMKPKTSVVSTLKQQLQEIGINNDNEEDIEVKPIEVEISDDDIEINLDDIINQF